MALQLHLEVPEMVIKQSRKMQNSRMMYLLAEIAKALPLLLQVSPAKRMSASRACSEEAEREVW
jgi:hypothetical protein